MLLTIDVGNTHTVLGLFDGDELVEHWRITTDAAPHRRRARGPAPGPAGPASAARRRWATDRRHRGLLDRARRCCTSCARCPPLLRRRADGHRRARACKTGVPVLIDNPKEVGADRIVNALAAVHLYGGPCDRRRLRHRDHLRRGSARGRVPRRRHRARHRDLRRRAGVARRAAAQGRAGPAARGDRQEHRRGAAVRHRLRLRRPGRRHRRADGRGAGRRPRRRDGDRHRRAGAAGARRGAVIDEHEPWLTLIGLRLVYERNTA